VPVATPPDPASLARPWISSYPPGVPPSYRLPAVPVTRFLDDAARDFPDQPALVVGGQTTSYRTLRDRVHLVAAVLIDAGIEPGDRVLVAIPNLPATLVVYLGLWHVGAVVVPVDPELRADRLVRVGQDAELAAVLGTRAVLQAFADRGALPPLALSVDGGEWPTSRRIPRPSLPAWPWSGTDRLRRAVEGVRPLREAMDAVGPASSPDEGATADGVALLAYRPRDRALRGVVLTHANLLANAFQARLWVPDTQAGRERVLVADGLHEVSTLILGALAGLLSAAALVVLDRPSPRELVRAVERHRPTLFATGARRLADLLAGGDGDLTSLRAILATGSPVDPQLAADLERRTGGARVREGYGLAEAATLTHAQPVYGRVVPRAIGLPVTSTVAAVVDPADLGALAPLREPGVLIVHGPQVAAGYWRQDDATAATFVDGWLITDDLVTVDEQGVFRHVGRRDEVIDRDGQLVSPRHTEATLERHPAVRRAGVVAADDGALLLAAVVARRRTRPDPDELLAHCRAHLVPAAVPDRISLVDELPETEAGDLARDQLRRDLTGR
jgi:long-chain acyl-CoA synthetase